MLSSRAHIPSGVDKSRQTCAREAGARTVDRDGSPHTVNSTATIAANPKLIDEMLELVHAASAALDA